MVAVPGVHKLFPEEEVIVGMAVTVPVTAVLLNELQVPSLAST